MNDVDPDFKLLFEESPDLLVVLLPDTPRFTIAAATRAWLHAMGTSRDVAVGCGLFDRPATDPGEAAALRASLDRVLGTRAADTVATPLLHNVPVLGADGAVRYILHRREDASEAALLHRELDHARGELEAFNYSVSHDLRAPLRAIDGFTQALAEDNAADLDARGRGYIERVRNAVARMNTFIDALLDLSRLSRSPLAFETVDLSALATAVAGNLRRAHPARTVAVEIEDALTATGDRRLMTVLLTHLLGNAWKFTARRPDARIELRRVPGDEPTFSIHDNGAGFDPAYATRLFAPFQRFHSAADFEGIGVGLATAQRIVTRHGGRIWAESAVDQGATFFFSLAASRGGAGAAAT
jgi:light-regulated signal transduction histidine kinase (bacteriophytochrome)